MANDEKKKKKKEEKKVVVAEFKVSMHCNACERTVAKAISKFKGVEKFATDMTRHKVTVTGRINPEKVMKKLRKKTGKRVEIVPKKEEPKEATAGGDSSALLGGDSKREMDSSAFDYWPRESKLLIMFSDENPNACSIM